MLHKSEEGGSSDDDLDEDDSDESEDESSDDIAPNAKVLGAGGGKRPGRGGAGKPQSRQAIAAKRRAAELASANSGKAKDVVETYLKKARVVFDSFLSDVWVDDVDDVKAAACLSDLKTQAKKASRNDGSLLEKVNDAIEQMDTGLSLVLKCRTWENTQCESKECGRDCLFRCSHGTDKYTSVS